MARMTPFLVAMLLSWVTGISSAQELKTSVNRSEGEIGPLWASISNQDVAASEPPLLEQGIVNSPFWERLHDSDAESILLTQGSRSAGSDSGGGGAGELAAKSQNPISDLVSLPLQSNWDFGIDPGSRTQYVGNLQPVVPVKLNEEWNLINRVIVPFVNAPTGPDLRTHGIGDMVGQFFFSPREPSHVIWGVGPAVLFPTASDPVLGRQEWGAGVDGVILISEAPIVAGVLVSQLWGVEGNTKPFLLQPFFNYNLPHGWFVSASGEANADWEKPEKTRWTVPVGAGIGRVFPLFGQPMNINTRFAPFLEKPPGGPDWEFRLQVTLLFPK